MADAPTRVTITTKNEVTTPQPALQSKQSFVQRILEFAITLTPDQKTNQPIKFAGTNSNTITLSGHRASVRIQNDGALSGNAASVTIFGMTPSLMNQLSVLGQVFNQVQQNSITISAGDDSGLSPVFGGTIWSALADYNSAPIVPFCIVAQGGYINNVVPAAASSFPQSTDVATIMAGFARQMGKKFQNSGVTIQMPPSYFPGTLMDQVRKCAADAHINADLVDADQTLAIWPIGGSRTSPGPVPLISKDTGMIGYPVLSPNGFVIVKTIFNPKIAFGQKVRIQSSISQANREWVAQKIDLDLDSLVPKGQWKSTLYCYPEELPAPAAPSQARS